MLKIRTVITSIVCILCLQLNAQDRFAVLESKLKALSKDSPGLNEKVELSVNGATIQEFVRGLANANNLNVSIDPSLNVKIYNNFSNVLVTDVFLFLCKKYELDINFIGTIMSFSQYAAPVVQNKFVSKQIKISYDKTTDLITMELANDSLAVMAKEITKITTKNIVYSPDLSGKLVSGYFQGMQFNNAMDKLAFANDLKVTLTNDNVYLIEKKVIDPKLAVNKTNFTNNTSQNGSGIKIDNLGLITADFNNTPISDVLASASFQLDKNYFLFSDLKGSATLHVTDATYDEFLRYLLNATDFTFKKDGDLYLIGDRNLEGLRATKVVQLQNRTVDKVLDFIPTELKKGVEIKYFTDLNSIILSGSEPRIVEIESFLRDIDKVVPNIQIEVIIADVRDTKTLTTGLEAGLSKTAKTTDGTIYPGINMTISSSSINNIISGINGLGVVNLGNVTPNFYITLKALEEQGILKLRSTPQLATLNGNEAKLKIGNKEYYLETSNNVIGSQNPQNIITQQYKSVDADLAVNINPIVSGDEQITLDINVQQTSFTERISQSAPPGAITRDFKSLIRVKNGEMIMLGGLEVNSTTDTGSGIPLLSRIPVIKWLFSSRTKKKSNNELTIFIRPTVLY